MQLSIVLPALNEEENLERAVTDALDYLSTREGEIIVVNDGSQDRTGEILDALSKKHAGRVRGIQHPINLGYAPALRHGFEAAGGQWIFYTDSDNQFCIQEIDKLFARAESSDIVVGYRVNRKDPPLRIFAARVYNFMVRLIFGIRGIRDVDCAFKLFRREVFERIQIQSQGFTVDTEILAKARRERFRITEVGVTHLPRTKGQSTVRPRDVGRALWGIAKLRWELTFRGTRK